MDMTSSAQWAPLGGGGPIRAVEETDSTASASKKTYKYVLVTGKSEKETAKRNVEYTQHLGRMYERYVALNKVPRWEVSEYTGPGDAINMEVLKGSPSVKGPGFEMVRASGTVSYRSTDSLAHALLDCNKISRLSWDKSLVDIRKVDQYGIYSRFDFRVPLGKHGDVFDRYMIRILEMRESLKILQQALRDIPAGPIIDPKAKIRNFKPKAGEAYGRIEGPKGELGFYLISDGSANPYRYRVRPPSLINLTVLEDMCLGQMIADVVIILGSIDIVLGEVDR